MCHSYVCDILNSTDKVLSFSTHRLLNYLTYFECNVRCALVVEQETKIEDILMSKKKSCFNCESNTGPQACALPTLIHRS